MKNILIIVFLYIAMSQIFSYKDQINIYTDSKFLKLNYYCTVYELINPTFLGNEKRNYYGNLAPSKLKVLWKTKLGCGKTIKGKDTVIWCGAGWTGQPLIVRKGEKEYIIQGAYDHKLRKIDLANGKIIWEYEFDDVIKGTGTIVRNLFSKDSLNCIYVLQGSRYGVKNNVNDSLIFSYRAINFETGKEIWRLNSKKTDCYSRDVDGSALIINDTAYIGLENGIFTIFDPVNNFRKNKNYNEPNVILERMLYEVDDIEPHKNNLVTESSSVLLGDRIYITSGSGHIYGYNLLSRQIDWDLEVGADIDGSPVVTSDSCLIVTLEKEYIKGKGGALKINPRMPPESSIVWFFPTGDKNFGSWFGGIIGTAATDDSYFANSRTNLCAFIGVDGYLNVVDHKEINDKNDVLSYDEINYLPIPKLLFRKYLGPAISTPIIVKDRLIVPTYENLWLFQIKNQKEVVLLDKYPAPFEATAVAHDGKIYIASRNGYLYCFGD